MKKPTVALLMFFALVAVLGRFVSASDMKTLFGL